MWVDRPSEFVQFVVYFYICPGLCCVKIQQSRLAGDEAGAVVTVRTSPTSSGGEKNSS